MKVVLTALGGAIAFDLLEGASGDVLDRLRGHVVELGPGLLWLWIAAALAPCLSSPTDVVRAGIALGATLPAAGFHWCWHHSQPFEAAAFIAIPMALAVLAARTARSSHEPARWRLLVTAVVAGALTVGTLGSCAWWPTSSPYGHRALSPELPTPYVLCAGALLVAGTLSLIRRRFAALPCIGLAGVAIAASPSLGAYSSGCMGFPGPLEYLPFAEIASLAVPLLWLGPVLRHLRGVPYSTA